MKEFILYLKRLKLAFWLMVWKYSCLSLWQFCILCAFYHPHTKSHHRLAVMYHSTIPFRCSIRILVCYSILYVSNTSSNPQFRSILEHRYSHTFFLHENYLLEEGKYRYLFQNETNDIKIEIDIQILDIRFSSQ